MGDSRYFVDKGAAIGVIQFTTYFVNRKASVSWWIKTFIKVRFTLSTLL